MKLEWVSHRLSLAIRFIDHFSRQPVADELPVRLADSLLRPVLRAGGGGRRQDDGAYRFIGAPGGPARVLWRRPFARGHGPWMRWEPDPLLVLPLAEPAGLVDVELWPAAHAGAAPAATGVRGKLGGPQAGGQTVRIARAGQPFERYTRSDDSGNFLFLPASPLTLDASGRVPLLIEVRAPDDTPRVVAGGSVVPADAGSAFAGAAFTVLPRVVSRLLFQLA